MKDTIKQLIFVFAGALCLMSDAFYNGFPIVYSDTSTYIASGFELETPFDRPITYGLFLRFFSLNGLSLWLVIFFQAVILSFLLYLIVRLITGKKLFLQTGLAVILFLSLFTGLSWTVSQLMPDIFTSVAIICMVLILSGKFNRATSLLLYFLFFISVAMHMSHILLFVTILLLAFAFRKFILPKQAYPDRNMQLSIMLVLTIVSVITMGSAISKSKHVFFMGAMAEHGILKRFLDDQCATKQYKLCAYRDSLPGKAYEFVWDEKSPFYKVGGWKESKSEFNEIIFSTLTQPKYIGMHISESIKATFQQLMLFDIGDGNGSFPKGTVLYGRISTYFNHDLANYSNSKQNQSHTSFIGFFNPVFSAVVALSLALLLSLVVFYKSTFQGTLKFILVLFFIAILLNAWSCGTFANAIDRLGCKMIWLIPLIALLSLAELFGGRWVTGRKTSNR